MKSLFNYLFALMALAGLVREAEAADSLLQREWTVQGVVRQALLFVPPQARTNPSPVVFAFHGHGGSMRNAARSFGYHREWTEAIVVYPQGLKTPGQLVDPQGNLAGWQKAAGDQRDRDLEFFDAMLASLKADYRVDEKRIYATGHSNGGGFTYLLWAERGDRFAAFAPSSAVAVGSLARMKPAPMLHVAGQNDPLVKFTWQTLMIERVRRLNQCGEGKEWGKWCTEFSSKVDAPVVTLIHPGTHQFPAEAPASIVKFFKQHARP